MSEFKKRGDGSVDVVFRHNHCVAMISFVVVALGGVIMTVLLFVLVVIIIVVFVTIIITNLLIPITRLLVVIIAIVVVFVVVIANILCFRSLQGDHIYPITTIKSSTPWDQQKRKKEKKKGKGKGNVSFFFSKLTYYLKHTFIWIVRNIPLSTPIDYSKESKGGGKKKKKKEKKMSFFGGVKVGGCWW